MGCMEGRWEDISSKRKFYFRNLIYQNPYQPSYKGQFLTKIHVIYLLLNHSKSFLCRHLLFNKMNRLKNNWLELVPLQWSIPAQGTIWSMLKLSHILELNHIQWYIIKQRQVWVWRQVDWRLLTRTHPSWQKIMTI